MSFKKILMLGGAVAVMTSGLMMQQAKADTSDLTVDALIVVTLNIDCSLQALDFGNLDSGAAGTVTMTTAGGRSSTTPSNLVPGGAPQQGQCALTGEPNFDVQITAPASVTLNNLTTPGDTLTVNNFQFDDATAGGATGSPFDMTLDGSGDQTLNIGADLLIAGGEDPGQYENTITITALYN